ncbi:MAG: hypothetical protein ACP5QT_08380 [Brevinematia bacterium]
MHWLDAEDWFCDNFYRQFNGEDVDFVCSYFASENVAFLSVTFLLMQKESNNQLFSKMEDIMKRMIFILLLLYGCSITPQNKERESVDSPEVKTGGLSVRIYSLLVKGNLFSKAYVEVSGPDFSPITNSLTIDYSSNLIYGSVAGIPCGKNRVCKIEIFDNENNLTGYGVTSNITILSSKISPVTVLIFLTASGYASVNFNITIDNFAITPDTLVKLIFLDITNKIVPANSNFTALFTNVSLVENASLRLILNEGGMEIYNGIVLSNLSITKSSNYTFSALVEIRGGGCELEGIITNGDITSLYLVDNFECGLFWSATNGFEIFYDSERKRSGLYSLKFSGILSNNYGIFASPSLFDKDYGNYISFWINGKGDNKSIVLRAGTNSCYWNISWDRITNGEVIYPSKSASYGSGFDTHNGWYEVKLYVSTNIVPDEFSVEFKGGSGGDYEFWIDDVYMY